MNSNTKHIFLSVLAISILTLSVEAGGIQCTSPIFTQSVVSGNTYTNIDPSNQMTLYITSYTSPVSLYLNGTFITRIGGIPDYGSMYLYTLGASTEVIPIVATNTFYQVTNSTVNAIMPGTLSNMTFQNYNSIKAKEAGTYQVVWSMSIEDGANHETEGTVMVDGTANTQMASHVSLPTGGKPETMAGTGLLNLSANDLVSLALLDHIGTGSITVDHLTMTLLRVNPNVASGGSGGGYSLPRGWTFKTVFSNSPTVVVQCFAEGGGGGISPRTIPPNEGFPNVPAGLALLGVSIALFIFSFLGIKRKTDGIVYLILFRVVVFLLGFAAFSVLVSPQTITYPAYNAVQGATTATFQTYNVTGTIPQGTQATLGWVEIAYSVIVLGSLGIDIVFGMRDKKG